MCLRIHNDRADSASEPIHMIKGGLYEGNYEWDFVSISSDWAHAFCWGVLKIIFNVNYFYYEKTKKNVWRFWYKTCINPF